MFYFFAGRNCFLSLLLLCLWGQGLPGNYSKYVNKFLFQINIHVYALRNQILRQREPSYWKHKLLVFDKLINISDLTKPNFWSIKNYVVIIFLIVFLMLIR